MADASVAAFYGVPWAGAGKRSSLASVKRRGILNQGAFLSVFATNGGSHPVFRGVALMRRIACLTTPDPGALGIVVSVPAADPQKTTRERFQVHLRPIPAARGCHTSIDAFGFAFENFDGIGQLRTTENGRPIDTGGRWYPVRTTEPTPTAPTCSGRCRCSDAVRACLARQIFRSSAARSDAPSVIDAEEGFVNVWKQLPTASKIGWATCSWPSQRALLSFAGERRDSSFRETSQAAQRHAPLLSAGSRRRHHAAAFLPAARGFSRARAAEASPLKLIVISAPHGIASECTSRCETPNAPDIAVEALSMQGTDTEGELRHLVSQLFTRPFDDAATYGESFKTGCCSSKVSTSLRMVTTLPPAF